MTSMALESAKHTQCDSLYLEASPFAESGRVSIVTRSECQAIFAKLGEAARLGHEANHDVGLLNWKNRLSKVVIDPMNP